VKRADLLSGLWLVLTLVGVAVTVTHGAAAKQTSAVATRSALAAGATYARTISGQQGVVDANGVVVPVGSYKRIATVSTIADGIAVALLEPERLYAMTDYGRKHTDVPHLYGSRMAVVGLHQLEELVDARVDLVITNHVRSQAELARMRDAGLQVFNLGEMRGLQTLIPNIHAVAALIGAPERGRIFAEKLQRRMHLVAADVSRERRKKALYVSAYASQLFGGAEGTSYHDVLLSAGLIDVSDGKYKGWVHYDPEQIIELDPELIVANSGTGEALCRIGGLERLRACQNGGAGIVTLSPDLLGDPGPRMLEATEALRTMVYGEPE
jgi:iron complex transport system substrate-binding protein